MSKFYKLSEVADITGIKLETLKTDSKRGHLATLLIPEKGKMVKVVNAETLALLLQKKDSSGYADCSLFVVCHTKNFSCDFVNVN